MYTFDPGQLRSARIARNLRPEQAAVAVGRCVSTVTNWERGTAQPSARILGELAEIYGCNPSAFFTCQDAA